MSSHGTRAGAGTGGPLPGCPGDLILQLWSANVDRPQDSKTNAADTAPGVDDGKVRGRGPSVNSKPGGRGIVWLIVGLSIAILAIVFIARPDGSNDEVAVSNEGPIVASAPVQAEDNTR